MILGWRSVLLHTWLFVPRLARGYSFSSCWSKAGNCIDQMALHVLWICTGHLGCRKPDFWWFLDVSSTAPANTQSKGLGLGTTLCLWGCPMYHSPSAADKHSSCSLHSTPFFCMWVQQGKPRGWHVVGQCCSEACPVSIFVLLLSKFRRCVVGVVILVENRLCGWYVACCGHDPGQPLSLQRHLHKTAAVSFFGC